MEYPDVARKQRRRGGRLATGTDERESVRDRKQKPFRFRSGGSGLLPSPQNSYAFAASPEQNLKGFFILATSKLQDETRRRLCEVLAPDMILENHRPEWLASGYGGRLELDFFIPHISFAIEVQGRQHARFTPLFHPDYQAFVDQQKRDRLKKELCIGHSVEVFEVWDHNDLDRAIRCLKRRLPLADPRVKARKVRRAARILAQPRNEPGQKSQRRKLEKLLTELQAVQARPSSQSKDITVVNLESGIRKLLAKLGKKQEARNALVAECERVLSGGAL